jgi:hypothetical protein
MPQPITPTSTDRRAVPRQRNGSHPPCVRALREQKWRTLVGSYRLFTRLTVEALKHHRMDDADTLARQRALVEEELEHAYPFRWSRHRPELFREQAGWWAEDHDDDVLACRACQLQHGGTSAQIDLPRSRRDRG